ncbi:hypothetical protein [Castellaniella sp.]|uniref:hypothetical protein n=1 Tax=Castellaniella sp. TaxID=1955812 RepID=UPI002AFE2F41|nr:hypothetical protein [Castellaniella sp.]
MARGPFDKYIARQAWFAALRDALPATPVAQELVGTVRWRGSPYPSALVDWCGRPPEDGTPIYAVPVAAQAQHCPTDVCEAFQADGVLCANDECDRENGVRPVAAQASAQDREDAERYRRIRNGPYSYRHGDVYAMIFQGAGDIPIKGDDLDAAIDAARAAKGAGDA